MKQNPCSCCKERNRIPTSKRGLCSRCEEIVKVIDYLVAQEQEALDKAKHRPHGLVLPSDVRQGG